ncbi:hypothetical protein SAY87_014905 [Trapa incisa]|uniref:Glycosidase n=1 Tax=Trapa incisa TaxID=236973 RepID=A0AAN7H0E8_9MYRT|nr:hypothetical protein SAY87_014905 [Trapa incisa]
MKGPDLNIVKQPIQNQSYKSIPSDVVLVGGVLVAGNRKYGKYLMVYEGVDMKGERSIGFTVSNDGLKEWSRLKEEPIFRPSEAKDSWDSRSVSSPYLVQLDGEERHYTILCCLLYTTKLVAK